MRNYRLSLFLFVFLFGLVFLGCSSDSKTLSVSPSELAFGDVNLGDDVSMELLLKNKYGKNIIISSISLAGTGSGDFVIFSGNNVPVNLEKNATHKVEIEFEPTMAGPIDALLSIIHDGSTKPKNVPLSGNGIPVARIELSETTYDFDKKLINKMHTHDFTIDNIGTASLDISNLSFSGIGAANYSITAGNAPVNIQPGNDHTFTVTFAPTVVDRAAGTGDRHRYSRERHHAPSPAAQRGALAAHRSAD